MRRGHTVTRCVGCRLHASLCICEVVRREAARIRDRVSTRVVVVMQQREASRSSNTGHLAAQLLPRVEVRRYGARQRRDTLDDLVERPGPVYLLYPDAGASLVDRRHCDPDGATDLTLVVPDASWRGAQRMAHRDPVLSRLPRVTLPAGGLPRWTLRAPPRSDGLCTLEALGRALAELHGPEVRSAVERVLEAHVHATLRARGRTRRSEEPGPSA